MLMTPARSAINSPSAARSSGTAIVTVGRGWGGEVRHLRPRGGPAGSLEGGDWAGGEGGLPPACRAGLLRHRNASRGFPGGRGGGAARLDWLSWLSWRRPQTLEADQRE